jgi:glycosyltransferase involved in cell wall biosynthesis
MSAVAPVAKPRLLFVVTEDWIFWTYRLDLARAARAAGWEVLVATRVQDFGKRIEDEGFQLFPVPFRRGGQVSWGELRSLFELVRLYRDVQPDLVYHAALKPILYGSWAARRARVPAVLNVFAGLGHVFMASGWWAALRRTIVGWALRPTLALPHSRVVFYNREDLDQFVLDGIVRKDQAVIIQGSGVDVEKFVPAPEKEGDPVVVLVSRMLRDKGVGEFVEAAVLLKAQGIRAKCVLVGDVDRENPTGIPEAQLREWQQTGVIEWWGHQENMPALFASAHIVVLPSYREGLSRVLLEGAACARPLVATDVPGCREIVRHGDNGLLVSPKDPHALFQAIAMLIRDPAMRLRMGRRGREIVVQEFSLHRIAEQTLNLCRDLLESRRVPAREPSGS